MRSMRARLSVIKSSGVTKRRMWRDLRASFRTKCDRRVIGLSTLLSRPTFARRTRDLSSVPSRRLRCARLREIGGNGKRPGFNIDLYAARVSARPGNESHEHVNTTCKRRPPHATGPLYQIAKFFVDSYWCVPVGARSKRRALDLRGGIISATR